MANIMTWRDICAVEDLSSGEMKALSFPGLKLALFRDDDGTYYATANVCTHEFALLTDGWLEDGEIECPLHSGRFCIKTGRALCKPAEVTLQTFDVREANGRIEIALPDVGTEAAVG